MAADDPPTPRPVPDRGEEDDRRPIAVGLILWLVATVVIATTAAIRQVPDAALWTCLAGVALGAAGLVYVRSRTRRR